MGQGEFRPMRKQNEEKGRKDLWKIGPCDLARKREKIFI
jgi:hypothetical protein